MKTNRSVRTNQNGLLGQAEHILPEYCQTELLYKNAVHAFTK